MAVSDLTKAAQGQACMNCGSTQGVVLAHYSGMRQHWFGKGRSIKGDDYAAAPQCSACHADGPFAEGWCDPALVDEDRIIQQLAKSEEQLYQIVQWHIRRNQ